MQDEYTVPGHGKTVSIRQETGKFGAEDRCICPSCGKDSFSVNRGSRCGCFRCWSCGISGKVQGKFDSYKMSKTYDSDCGYGATGDELNIYIQHLADSLEMNQIVSEYANSHAISEDILQQFDVGYSKDKPSYPDFKIAADLGLVNKKPDGRYTNRFYGRIVFPIMNDGKYVFAVGRKTNEKQNAKFINVKSTAPLFNIDVIKNYEDIYLCEGIPDALANISNGTNNTVAVLGAHSFKDSFTEYFVGKRVFLALDNDKAGTIGAREIKETLEGKEIEVINMEIGGKDVADSLSCREGDKKKHGEKLQRRKKVIYVRSGDNVLVFGYGDNPPDYDIVISVRDIIERKQSLKVKLGFKYRDGEEYDASCDIANIRSRAMYANAAHDLNDILSKKELKQLLNDLYTGVMQQLDAHREEQAHPERYVPSEIEVKAAQQFLRSNKLLFQIKNMLRRQQVVEEDVNKILLYLIFTSRLMQRPISAIVKGLSSSGKTYIIKQVLTLIPPEGVFVTHDASAKAFYYVGENDLSHRTIVIGETHGTEQTEYTIREAQDGVADGDLIITTVEKNADTNQMQTVTKRVKGPCGFITSTTNPDLNPENETRNFSLFVGVNQEKIKKTDVITEEKYTFTENLLTPEEILLTHNAQRCLEKDLKVKIPYVRTVLNSFPTSHARVMRDRGRFFTILETISILHQFQEGRATGQLDNGDRYIEASLCDYNIALCLMKEVLVETLHELSPKSKEIYSKAIEMKGRWIDKKMEEEVFEPSGADFEMTYKEIAEEMNMKVDEVRRWAKPLREQGYFNYIEGKIGGRGKEAHLYPVEKDFYESFLPTAEQIARKHPQYYGEKLYDPITGKERVIKRMEEDIIEL